VIKEPHQVGDERATMD